MEPEVFGRSVGGVLFLTHLKMVFVCLMIQKMKRASLHSLKRKRRFSSVRIAICKKVLISFFIYSNPK